MARQELLQLVEKLWTDHLSEADRAKISKFRELLTQEIDIAHQWHYMRSVASKTDDKGCGFRSDLLVRAERILRKEGLDCALDSLQSFLDKLQSTKILEALKCFKLEDNGWLSFTPPASDVAAKEEPKAWWTTTSSTRYGKTHPDTFFCNDLPKLKRDFTKSFPRVLGLDFYTDDN